MYRFIITESLDLTETMNVSIYIFTPPVHRPELKVAEMMYH